MGDEWGLVQERVERRIFLGFSLWTFDLYYHKLVKNNSILFTVHLCLPNSISYTPQAGNDEEYNRRVWVRSPEEQDDHQNCMNQHTKNHYRCSTDEFHDWSEDNWTDGIDDTKTDHNVAYIVNTQGTGHICLKQKKRVYISVSSAGKASQMEI